MSRSFIALVCASAVALAALAPTPAAADHDRHRHGRHSHRDSGGSLGGALLTLGALAVVGMIASANRRAQAEAYGYTDTGYGYGVPRKPGHAYSHPDTVYDGAYVHRPYRTLVPSNPYPNDLSR